ncbi:Uncharacterized protein dnm_031680 [Desulfonema magnum]|uniref:Uncharacterized protein n=1 Tax=Desulfonema magnum TaxID=45655 RepID=A0A975BKK2_9BACT|nr:Uncharacterized protein dnm_031680 [Desulfonema magnum]
MLCIISTRSKVFYTSFFSVNSGETRLFPSRAADRSCKKSRVSSSDKYRKLMVR